MKKKIGVRLKFKGGLNKGLSPDMWGQIDLLQDDEIVGDGAGFTISEEKIYVDTLDIYTEYQRLGYGTLIIDVIKGIAELLEKPVHIYSINNSYPFYEAQGFVSVLNPEMRKKLILKRKSNPLEHDYIWIPDSLKYDDGTLKTKNGKLRLEV